MLKMHLMNNYGGIIKLWITSILHSNLLIYRVPFTWCLARYGTRMHKADFPECDLI